jgi:hypothetical protein
MAAPSSRRGKSIQYFMECDERFGSLYSVLLKDAPAMARQGRLIISIKAEPKRAEPRRKASTSRSKKTSGA